MSESDSSGENNIEKIEDKYILDGTINYIVKYKNMRTCMSVTFDQLNKKEQNFIRNCEKLLNQKSEKRPNNDNKYDSFISQNKKGKYNNNEEPFISKNKKKKYNNDEEPFISQHKKRKYSNDEEPFISQHKKKKYNNDEEPFISQHKKKKYNNDEEPFISQHKKRKYSNDEESENSQKSFHHKIENKFNKKYKEHNNKESKKIYQKQNSFDDNFGDNNDFNDFSMSSKFERDGTLLDDVPVKILNVGTKNRNDTNLFCLVRWKQTNKDIRISDSIIDIKKIKKACPELLIDFYESKIIFSQYLDD